MQMEPAMYEDDPLSLAPPESKPKAPQNQVQSWFWPVITDSESARSAARGARTAAIVCAAVTLIFTLAAMAGAKLSQGLGLTVLSLVDVFLFGILAWGIHRMSRTAAVLGLLLFVAERLMAGNATKGIYLTIVFTLWFISGVRGTFAYHQYKTKGDPAVSDTFA
jgi:hypothetical protein